MKFVLHACCLSIVWVIAFAGCSLKHYETMSHDVIGLQAKTDAESDASHDANALAYLGAGVSIPFAAAPCGYMTGCVSALIVENGQGSSSCITASLGSAKYYLPVITAVAGSAAVLSLLIAYHSRPPNPPPERLIGKSPKYVQFYAKVYRSKMRSYRMRAVAAGSIVGCTAMTIMSAIIFSNI